MTKVDIVLKISTTVDGIYGRSMEDTLFEEVTEGIYGVFDIDENCALINDSIELVSVEEHE